MDVLLSIIIGIVLTIIIDKHFKTTAKVSFAVLNFVLTILMIFSSNDPIVSKVVTNFISSSSYGILHDALINKDTISIISYSSYDLLCLLTVIGLVFVVLDMTHESSKDFYKALNELLELVKKNKIVFSDVLTTKSKKICDELYNHKHVGTYFLRC